MGTKYIELNYDNETICFGITEHVGKRYDKRELEEKDFKSIFDKLYTIYSDCWFMSDVEYILRDFSTDIGLIFSINDNREDKDSFPDPAYKHDYLIELITTYGSAAGQKQYPYTQVFVIDDDGRLIQSEDIGPYQIYEYEEWFEKKFGKKAENHWKWPENWSATDINNLNKNPEPEKIKKLYPFPKNYFNK